MPRRNPTRARRVRSTRGEAPLTIVDENGEPIVAGATHDVTLVDDIGTTVQRDPQESPGFTMHRDADGGETMLVAPEGARRIRNFAAGVTEEDVAHGGVTLTAIEEITRTARLTARLMRDQGQTVPVTYTVNDIAQILSVSYHAARNMINRGDFGEPLREGSHSVVTQQGLVHYLQEQRDHHYTECLASETQLNSLLDALNDEERAAIDLAHRPDIPVPASEQTVSELTRMGQALGNVATAFETMVDEMERATIRIDEMHDTLRANDATMSNQMREIADRVAEDREATRNELVALERAFMTTWANSGPAQPVRDISSVRNHTIADVTWSASQHIELNAPDSDVSRRFEEARQQMRALPASSSQQDTAPEPEQSSPTPAVGAVSDPSGRYRVLIRPRSVESNPTQRVLQYMTSANLGIGDLVRVDPQTGHLVEADEYDQDVVGTVLEVRDLRPEHRTTVRRMVVPYGQRGMIDLGRDRVWNFSVTQDGAISFESRPTDEPIPPGYRVENYYGPQQVWVYYEDVSAPPRQIAPVHTE